MSIIIHFNPSPYVPSAAVVPSTPPCLSKSATKLEMLPGIEHSDGPVMTDDESSMVDIATSNTLYTHVVKEVKTNVNHSLGSCFGLPYQDHNYGAPPPPTPPSCSPCASPAHTNGIPDEDTNLSVVSTSTTNEEAQGGSSITRCICGFEHDDEYMICCDRCLVWQHVDCMGLDRNNIPDTYLCEKCEPRKVDRHKAKVLQARKKVAMTDTSESDEESSNKNSERRPKTRSKRRKKEDEKNEEKADHAAVRKSKSVSKHAKERIEMKRSKLRRTKNKESTSTADEEAQDAWEYSLEWCEKNFESALNNQYTPEVQHIARQLTIQGFEKKFLEQLQSRQCRVVEGSVKRLVCMCDLPRDQPLIEYKGKFLLASQFYELHPIFNKKLYPYVLFYMLNQEEICVDASVYGNDARFVRKSCKPNADIRHMVYNGNLHLYLSSTKVIFKEDEVTVPFDFNDKESLKDSECACESDDCLLKSSKKNGSIEICQEKKRKGRRTVSSADDDSSHSLGGGGTSKTKTSPVKNISVHQALTSVSTHTSSEHSDTKGPSDHETEEQINERKKKMTREERKIDAIMRAFDQMEKAERRRQQALERQKTLQPKNEEVTEKPETVLAAPKEEEKVAATVSGSESHCPEDKVSSTPKPKKGKRRRGSGTPSRRRTRTNSGGSDILSPDDTLPMKSVQLTPPPVSSSDSNVHTSCETPSVLPAALNILSSSPIPPVVPILLKTKRSLLHEWLQVKSEGTAVSTPVTSPLSIHTEVKWNVSESAPTCYVRCTKDGPHSGGISAAHLRRSSSSGHIRTIQTNPASGPASAKKRWLRQAMHDCNTCDVQLSIEPCSMEALPSPIDNGYLSPTCHTDLSSPGCIPDDSVTPLKKRRLMRESIESVPSPLSPSVTNCLESTSATISNSLSSEMSIESGIDASDQQLLCVVNSLPVSPGKESASKINGIRFDIDTPREVMSADEMEISDGELCSFPSACNSFYEKLDSDEHLTCNTPGSSMQIHCDLELKIRDDIKEETVQEAVCSESSQNDYLKTLGQKSDLAMETCFESKSHLSNVLPERKFLDDNKNCDIISSEGAFVTGKNESISAQNLLSRTYTDNQVLSPVNTSNCVTSHVSLSLNQVAVSSCELTLTSPKVSEHSQFPKDGTDHASNQDINLCEEQNSISAVNVEHSVSPVIKNCVVSNCSSSSSNISNQTVCSNVSSSALDCINIPVSVQASSSNSDNVEKLKEMGESDVQSAVASNEPPESVLTTRASATQKRKVSLSEYRLRMRESINRVSSLETSKKSKSASKICATAIPEKLPEQVTLAPLPLFDTSVAPGSPTHSSSKSVKKKNETVKTAEEEAKNECVEYRGNLTERLKREFGFDDDLEGSTLPALSQTKPVNNAKASSNQITPSVPVCAQPPPPPPPPRPPRPNQTILGGPVVASSSQFGFHVASPYPQPPYIVNQVPGAQYVPAQPTLAVPTLSSVHPMNSTGVQCTVRPPLLPSAHSFASSVPNTVLRPPTQHEYASINAQNYAALVHQPPPPPPQKAYPHVYQPGLYK